MMSASGIYNTHYGLLIRDGPRQPASPACSCDGIRGDPEQAERIKDTISVSPDGFCEIVPNGIKDHLHTGENKYTCQ